MLERSALAESLYSPNRDGGDEVSLDAMIAQYGLPAFIKIDVEGFELEVLRGLSCPVPCISMEFTPEYIENTFAAVEHVESIGPVRVQISYGESMEFALDEWQTPEQFKRFLLRGDSRAFGDRYLRSSNSTRV